MLGFNSLVRGHRYWFEARNDLPVIIPNSRPMRFPSYLARRDDPCDPFCCVRRIVNVNGAACRCTSNRPLMKIQGTPHCPWTEAMLLPVARVC